MKHSIRDVATIGLASCMLAAGAAADGSRYSIENAVNTFDENQVQPTEVGYQYWFADKAFADGKTLKLSVVKPHSATHQPHVHEEDEFFFVLEGTAEFYLDGETEIGGPMTSFYCPTGMKHGIRNIGDTELKYLVIKTYIIR
jgi:mannose-6-phosphate isomerase-like protein (cupin superfamily)